MTTADLTTEEVKQDLVITRIFNAPREVVWKAWTDPERLVRWWGPKTFTAPVCQLDLRVGGKYLFCMRSPEGLDFWSTGEYREIVEPERMVYTDSFADAEGNVVPATHYGMDADFPLEMLVTVTFEEYEGKTKLTLRHSGLPAGTMSDMTGQGWSESFDKLAESLPKTQWVAGPGNQSLTMTRTFAARREKVFQTMTDPRLIPQWWGPRLLTTTVEQMEVRKGGIWRFVQRDSDGSVYAFNGVYHEAVSPERLVYTFEFEGMPGHVLLEIVTFEEQDGMTKVTDTSVFESALDRDGILQSGMEEGATETMDRLAELLAKV